MGRLWKFLDTLIRRYNGIMHIVVMAPLYGLASLCLGISLVPGLLLFNLVSRYTLLWTPVPHYCALGVSIATGYFLYGFSLILLVPLVNFVLRTSPSPGRGPYYTLDATKWFIHNGLTYLVRHTFLEFITPTPFNILFFSLMGMKIGRGSQINSSHISDPALIEMGDQVTIGGSATLVAHYGVGGYLVIAPVKIGNRVTIGLKAIIMGGVDIGDDVRILPNSVVLPKTKIPAGETWGGVPAYKIKSVKKAA